MNFKSKPFCLAPWVSMQYGALLCGPNGGTTPCCEWSKPAFEGNVTDYVNSTYLKEIKNKMISVDMDYLSFSCKDCLDQEKVGLKSRRLTYHTNYNEGKEMPDSIVNFDYRPGNVCNLKCRMCSPINSSQIAKEEGIDLVLRDTIDFHGLDFTKACNISIVGGEPSIDPKVHLFLDKLIKEKIASNIDLQITTNATNINYEWKKMLSAFRNVDVIISLDGTGATYEYIRTNANWGKVRKNCTLYMQNFKTVNYQITLSILNVVSIEDWLEWFIQPNIDANVWLVEGKEHLTLSVLPDDMRHEKLEYLSSIDHKIARTASKMLSQTQFNRNLYNTFVRWTKHFDSLRKTDCSKVSSHHARLMSYANIN